MLTIITKANAIDNGTSYRYDALSKRQIIGDVNRRCPLLPGINLSVSILGNDEIVCDTCGIDGFFLNFGNNTDKILVSPAFLGEGANRKKAEIILQFSQPIHGAGVQLGVIHLDSPRSFLAQVTAIDRHGNRQPSSKIPGITTDDKDGSALFLGAICNGDDQEPELSAIEFSVERSNDSPRFQQFAIGNLFYMVNHIR